MEKKIFRIFIPMHLITTFKLKNFEVLFRLMSIVLQKKID